LRRARFFPLDCVSASSPSRSAPRVRASRASVIVRARAASSSSSSPSPSRASSRASTSFIFPRRRVVVVARASRVARGRDGDEIVDAVFVARASARRRVGASARVAFFG
jgi:hypothetical protein